MRLDPDHFEFEAIKLLDIYQDLKNRGGADNKYNTELVENAVDILQSWEKILIISEIDSEGNDHKILAFIKAQMQTLNILREAQHEN